MALVKNLINQAYAQIGIISDDEEADGTDGALGVQILNQIINQANVEQLFPFMQTVTTYTFVASQASYTIGASGADITAERPEYISRIFSYSSATSNPWPVKQLDLADLLGYVSPNSSGTPDYFAYNADYPNGVIYFDRMPTVGNLVKMVYTKAFPTVTIDDDLTTIPPKYDSFIVASLAQRLSVHKKRPPEIVSNCQTLFQTARQYILTSNSRSQIGHLSFVSPLCSNGRTFLEGR